MLRHIKTKELWLGGRVNGVTLPPKCEKIWTEDVLQAHGLERFAHDVAQATPTAQNVAEPKFYTVNDGRSDIAILAAWASYCVSNGVQAGDYLWHGGTSQFEADGMAMDAVDYLEYARNQVQT